MPLEGPIEIAANRLARRLRDYPWYHRTTMGGGAAAVERLFPGRFRCERSPMPGPCDLRLCVWGEGDSRPAEVPAEFMGFAIDWARVTRRRPCPFGSVKPPCRRGRLV